MKTNYFARSPHLMLAHLYSLISSILQILRPHHMPKPLHSTTSRIMASHQHSTKFGSKCAKAISVISHIIDMAHKIPMCLIRTACESVAMTLLLQRAVHFADKIFSYLEHPSQVMSNSKDVNIRPDTVEGNVRTVHTVLLNDEILRGKIKNKFKSNDSILSPCPY